MNYYNELDSGAAEWLRELIRAGEIPPGHVDETDIRDVKPDDLAGYTQCHFFAGIGGWPLALRLAGWPEDRPVWTGSCPCQPFSAAGRGLGTSDERHLWPHWFHLLDTHRPENVFGEQVASKDGLGWFDLVSADLEGAGYAVGVADLCAASVGAPHIRQRLFFGAVRMADANIAGSQGRTGAGHGSAQLAVGPGSVDGRLGDTDGQDLRGGPGGRHSTQDGVGYRAQCNTFGTSGGLSERQLATGPTNGFWRDADWLGCRDGKWRPVEPGSFPLAHGIPGRVGLLRGYGNAIVPQVAAAFIEAFDEAVNESLRSPACRIL